MKEGSVVFIGLDTSKSKISVAVADGVRNGEVRFFGDISSEPASVTSMVNRLSKRGAKLHFCYEAGPTGYGLYRQIVELGHDCVVVAPSLVPSPCEAPPEFVPMPQRRSIAIGTRPSAAGVPGFGDNCRWLQSQQRLAVRSLQVHRQDGHSHSSSPSRSYGGGVRLQAAPSAPPDGAWTCRSLPVRHQWGYKGVWSWSVTLQSVVSTTSL